MSTRPVVDAVVIGGGAMGSAATWWLARRGRTVVLAEQFAAGHVRGSSHGEVRIFRLAYPDVTFVRMAQEALPLWRELEDDAQLALLDQRGCVDHGPEPALAPIAAALTAADAPHRLLTASAAQDRWPQFRFETPVLFHPDGGRIFADRTVAALQIRATAHGADVRYDSPARIVANGPDAVEVDVAGDVVRARCVVVTAGAWVERTLSPACDHPGLPALTVTQQTVAHFPPLDPSTAWPSFIDHRAGVLYGLASITEGIKLGGHDEGVVTDVDRRTYQTDPGHVQRLVDYATRWLPGVRPDPQFGSTCLYTTTPDESFVVARRGRVVVGSACSGHGFKFTPLIGRQLADLADELR